MSLAPRLLAESSVQRLSETNWNEPGRIGTNWIESERTGSNRNEPEGRENNLSKKREKKEKKLMSTTEAIKNSTERSRKKIVSWRGYHRILIKCCDSQARRV